MTGAGGEALTGHHFDEETGRPQRNRANSAVHEPMLLGTVARPGADASGRPAGDRTPDRYWKGGLFYVNRDDPAWLVEKRFGVGYSFNFGNPRAWMLLGALLLFIVLTAVLPLLK